MFLYNIDVLVYFWLFDILCIFGVVYFNVLFFFVSCVKVFISKLLSVCASMPKEKSSEWKHVVLLSESDQHSDAAGSVKMQCVYCSKVYSGGVGRIRSHLLGNNSMKKCKD